MNGTPGDARTQPPERVIAYIDGFNLFFGMRDSGWRRYYWLNPSLLANQLIKSNQTLVAVRYFSARIKPRVADPDKHVRQSAYLEAIETLPDTSVIYGHYLSKDKTCAACGATWQRNEEKMTDVNIAVSLLADAFDDAFDVALLVSADSDLAPPIGAVLARFPEKRVVVAFPPKRNSAKLVQTASVCFTIGRKTLQDSQFPNQVRKPDGYLLQRPGSWR